MEEKCREREAPDDVNEKEMDVIEESDDINEMEMNAMKEKRCEILEAPLPPTPNKCENNDSASSSTDQHEQHQPKDSIIDIKELEELMEILGDPVDSNLMDIHVPVQQCCIYRVPTEIRKINEAAYTPQILPIPTTSARSLKNTMTIVGITPWRPSKLYTSVISGRELQLLLQLYS